MKKMLDSLDSVDAILLGDGRFPDSAWGTSDPKQIEAIHRRYPPGNKSTDGSKKLAESNSKITWLDPPEQGYSSETEKMNIMLEKIPVDDWVLEIDPDEVLVGNIRGAIPAIPCDIVSMRVVDVDGHSLYYSRLFKKKKGMSFATHHSLHYEQGVDVEQYNGKAPENFYIRHERIEV